MKSMLQVLLLTAVGIATIPVTVYAQNNVPLTRAQVRQNLVRLEKAGYSPGANDPHYPDDLLAAEARVAAMQGASVGGEGNGQSASGAGGISAKDNRAMYGNP